MSPYFLLLQGWFAGLLCAGAALLAVVPTAWADEVAEVIYLQRAEKFAIADANAPMPELGALVSLPDAWNKSRQEGLWAYRLSFELEVYPSEPWALYIPRLGNRFRIELNGHSLAQLGRFGDRSSDYAQRPHYFPLPEGSLRAGDNRLRITLEGERGRYAGLSAVQIGPDSLLRPVYTWRDRAQSGGSLVVIAMCAVFALLGLALYAALRQASDGFFSLSCLFCAVRTSYAVVEHVPFDFRAWNWLVDICYAGLVATIVAFCVRALVMNTRRWDPVVLGFSAVSLVLVSWHTFAQENRVRQLWTMLMLLFVLVVSLTVVWQWWRQRTGISAALALAAVGGLALGAHDHWLVFYTSQGYGGFALARYALVLFILAMGWIIVDRLIARMREERALRLAVAHELEEKKKQLDVEYEIRSRQVAELAHMVEREKLLQDLHDGMGLQLNSLLCMVEKGEAQKDEVQTEVRNSIEQLRVLIDGSETFDGTLAELLGHIRYRIESRLKKQGIRLDWSGVITTSPQRVRAAAAVSLQRLVFELCTNVIKHANASCVRLLVEMVEVSGRPTDLRLHFEDDGKSACEPVQGTGMGQRSIGRRVLELGGTHGTLISENGAWTHQVSIPIDRLIDCN